MIDHSPRVRRDAILKLVRAGPVRSQVELLKRLNQRGLRVTQPTLSRDLKELGIAKTASGYVTRDDLSVLAATGTSFSAPQKREEKLNQVLREFVVAVEPAGSLVVLRTPSADAQPVARAMDDAALPDVAGTLAGDDTVFVAARSRPAAQRLVRRFLAVLNLPRR